MTAPRPWTLIAELTYACPLRCAYCSNPVQRRQTRQPLSTVEWQSLMAEADGLGVVQVHFTGGEPLLHPHLERLVASARARELYTTLVTSGVPLERERLQRLAQTGLEHVQLSLQSLEADTARRVCGVDKLAEKLAVAGWVKELGLSLTLNVVLTRHNIHEVEELVSLAERLGADRLELANTQYLGWALRNRAALLPTLEAIECTRQLVKRARARLVGSLDIVHVLPDYFAERPRACMEGWAQRYLVITPDGLLLPCHAAQSLPDLTFDDVRSAPLPWLWENSPALRQFRGEDWLEPPCSSCESRHLDRAGCRCQAYALTGRASAPDPSCALVPSNQLVRQAVAAARVPVVSALQLRRPPAGPAVPPKPDDVT
jgi:pyrroloquinoline quinone biosynthesis protein E